MQRSTERILTTDAGSLSRPATLLPLMFAQEVGESVDPDRLEAEIQAAVKETVRKQANAGVDVLNDGEVSKPSYATYVKDRLTGFGGEGSIQWCRRSCGRSSRRWRRARTRNPAAVELRDRRGPV
jgi:5-methyltetrahydropteroyltriglutamate--homocysteine methyltransferase